MCNPQGGVGGANQEISRFLRTFCAENQDDCAQVLPWAKHVQKSLYHSANQLTLFQCVLVYQSSLFPWNGNPTDSPSVNDYLKQSKQVQYTHQCLKQVPQTMKGLQTDIEET